MHNLQAASCISSPCHKKQFLTNIEILVLSMVNTEQSAHAGNNAVPGLLHHCDCVGAFKSIFGY